MSTLADFDIFTDEEIAGRTTDAIDEHDLDSCRQFVPVDHRTRSS